MVNIEKLKVTDHGAGNLTRFGDVITALAAEKKINKSLLAAELEVSPSTLSLVGNGERGLSDFLLDGLVRKFGGEPEVWRTIHEQTKKGAHLPLRYFLDLLAASSPLERLPGSRVRRLRKPHLEKFLAASDTEQKSKNNEKMFRIHAFSSDRIRVTSYDTVVGSFIEPETGKRRAISEAFDLPPQTSILATTEEAITLPKWMEADVHPATSLAKKHLIVSGGPIIDPEFDNFLTAAIYNPLLVPVTLFADEPFLTLRFWLQEID